MKQVTIKIDDTTYSLLNNKAEADGNTISGVMREAVMAYFSEEKEAEDIENIEAHLQDIRALAIMLVASQKSKEKPIEMRIAEVVKGVPRMIQAIEAAENE